jgi:hypothetical protein
VSTLHPGGASGVLLWSNGPNTALYADLAGSVREALIKFSVISAWGEVYPIIIWEKSSSAEHNPAMKWFLNVQMACSAAFRH